MTTLTTTGPRTGFWVLTATILASSMAFIDGSALSVALPALQADLGASAADLLWVNNAYGLMLAALILVGGALGDLYGRKRIFMLGIGLFAAASLLCGIAPNSALLIAARTVQGLGGSLMIPGSLALISANFGENQRGAAIGTWSAFSTITTILGPGLGGVLASAGLWRLVFLINLPLAAVALWVLLRHVPESHAHQARKLDYPGAVLATLGLAGITYGLIEVPAQGWTSAAVVVALAVGLLALVGFVLVELRSPEPMLPLSLFRSPIFSGTNLLTLFLYGGLYGIFFFLPLNLIQVQGYNEALAGMANLPLALMLAILARPAGSLADRFGPRLPLTIGPALAGAAFAWLAWPGLTGGPGDYWLSFFGPIVLLGLGMAITITPLSAAVMGAVDSERAGIASGVNNAVSRIAGVLAIAVMGLVALTSFAGALEQQALAQGLDEATRSALAQEAPKLAGAVPPANLDATSLAAAQTAIKLAFIDVFRLLCFVSAGLAWISAGVAWVMLQERGVTSDESGQLL
jgi:EmrB/QacA subfamily drug resistance transporter